MVLGDALFMVLGVLEDTGYLARAAYITDRAMAPLGLSGKSVLPLVVGFGCNVPVLLVPFVSCSARLPIYVLLAALLAVPGIVGIDPDTSKRPRCPSRWT